MKKKKTTKSILPPIRRGKPFLSLLKPVENEIMDMWDAGKGATLVEIQEYSLSKGISLSISTISSFINRRKSKYLKSQRKLIKKKIILINIPPSEPKIPNNNNSKWNFNGDLKRRYETHLSDDK